MFRLKVSLIALALAGLAAAAPDALAQSKPTIGIAMPTKSSARWIDDGNNMVKVLKERGYGTDLQYADDDIPNQLDRKSTRLNSSHVEISYAVFCLKKKKKIDYVI